MKKIVCFIASILISSPGFATTGWAEINITALRAGIGSSYHYVYFDALDPGLDPNGCGKTSEAVYPTTGEWKILHSMALAALLANKPLRVRFDGCHSGRPTIDIIEVHK